jgi:hypothetical protein
VATIGVVGRHRSLRLARTHAHSDRVRADVRRAWLAPLLALLAIGLLPVLGRSLVWLGTAATDAPVAEATTAAPSSAPTPAVPSTPAPSPSPVSSAPTAAASSSSAAAPPAARARTASRSAAPPSPVAVVPPVVVVPSGPEPDPATVEQPDGTSSQGPTTSDVEPSGSDEDPASDPGPVDSSPPDPPCADCELPPETPLIADSSQSPQALGRAVVTAPGSAPAGS